MNLNPFCQKPSLVGLDIQTDGVRIVQMKKIRHVFRIETIVARSFPTHVFAEGKIKQWDPLTTFLTDLVVELGIKRCSAAIQIPANLVRMQRMLLPTGLTEKDIEAEIYAQVRHDFPGLTDALCIDFTEIPQKNSGHSTIIFTAARREYVTQYVECVNAAGLQVKLVDVDIYALKRAISASLQLSNVEVHALVQVRHDTATLIIFNVQEILFHQHWEMDSAIFVKHLKNNLQLFRATFRHIQIHALIVCGAQDDFEKIHDEIVETISIPVYFPDPFANVHYAAHIKHKLLKTNAADFVIACGLAMHEVPTW